MSRFLWAYTDVGHDGEPHSFNPVGGQWSKAADQTARTINFGEQKSSYLLEAPKVDKSIHQQLKHTAIPTKMAEELSN